MISLLGFSKALELCNGMWAIALYDHVDNTISLSRDRFGEKPLYYSYDNDELIFSSELKTLLELSGKRSHTLILTLSVVTSLNLLWTITRKHF